MGKIPEGYAMVIGAQTAEGVANTAVRNATVVSEQENEPTNEAIGLLFDPETLALDFDRVEDPRPDYPGSFSKSGGDFQRLDIPMSFAIPAKGGGQTVTPLAGEYDLHPAVELLMASAGISSKLQNPTNTVYTPKAIIGTSLLTAKLWRGQGADTIAYVFKDIKTAWTLSLNAGETNDFSVTASIGSLDDGYGGGAGFTQESFPSINPLPGGYGSQLDLAAPILGEGAPPACSIGALARGGFSGTLTLDNQVEEDEDWNVDGGRIEEQSGRTFSMSGSFYADDSDPTLDMTRLLLPGPDTNTFSIRIGSQAGIGERASALSAIFKNPNYTKVAKADSTSGGKVVWQLEFYATQDGSGDDEFQLVGN